jgi:hypothetical protein
MHVTSHRGALLAQRVTRIHTRPGVRPVSWLELVVVVHVHSIGAHVRAVAPIPRTVRVPSGAGRAAALARPVRRGVARGGEQTIKVHLVQAAVPGHGVRQRANGVCKCITNRRMMSQGSAMSTMAANHKSSHTTGTAQHFERTSPPMPKPPSSSSIIGESVQVPGVMPVRKPPALNRPRLPPCLAVLVKGNGRRKRREIVR